MDKLWAIGLIQLWLFVMVYGWLTNRAGSKDQPNYERFRKSAWTRWMLSGQTRAVFLRQRSRLHKLTLPFIAVFYLFAMYGILFF